MTDNKIYLQSTSSDPSKQSSSLSHFHELWIHCSPVRHCHSVSEEQIVVLEVVQLDSSLWSLQSGSPSQYHSWSMHCLSAHWNSSAVQVKGAKEQREKKRKEFTINHECYPYHLSEIHNQCFTNLLEFGIMLTTTFLIAFVTTIIISIAPPFVVDTLRIVTPEFITCTGRRGAVFIMAISTVWGAITSPAGWNTFSIATTELVHCAGFVF